MDGKIYKVFVSSTYDDLREERAAVQRALLQLDCLPVGMELFPAADEETWEFIKSQIEDADYYVVVVAGRYGSVAPDGLSFTEKEYDYALAKNKPTIGFVHAYPGSIAVERSEQLAESQSKLVAFLQKVKRRPVRTFTNPHELALEVTTSFVKLIRERPSEGYVRSSEVVDYKRYASLLEENNALKEQLNAVRAIDTTPFKGHDKPVKLLINLSRRVDQAYEQQQIEIEYTLGIIFSVIAEAILQNDIERNVLFSAADRLAGSVAGDWTVNGFKDENVLSLRRQLQLYGLVQVSRDTVSQSFGDSTRTDTVNVWRLTDYGRRQLQSLTGA